MRERNLNALLGFIISMVLSGGFAIQLFKQEIPCPLCYLQRLGMLGVAAGALMNVKFGPHKRHYGLSLLAACFGGFVALRQIALHVCPGTPTFGHPFWGLSLYTWSFIVFICSIAYIALLLLIFDKEEDAPVTLPMNRWGKTVWALLFLIALGNVGATLLQCGFGPCADV